MQQLHHQHITRLSSDWDLRQTYDWFVKGSQGLMRIQCRGRVTLFHSPLLPFQLHFAQLDNVTSTAFLVTNVLNYWQRTCHQCDSSFTIQQWASKEPDACVCPSVLCKLIGRRQGSLVRMITLWHNITSTCWRSSIASLLHSIIRWSLSFLHPSAIFTATRSFDCDLSNISR